MLYKKIPLLPASEIIFERHFCIQLKYSCWLIFTLPPLDFTDNSGVIYSDGVWRQGRSMSQGGCYWCVLGKSCRHNPTPPAWVGDLMAWQYRVSVHLYSACTTEVKGCLDTTWMGEESSFSVPCGSTVLWVGALQSGQETLIVANSAIFYRTVGVEILSSQLISMSFWEQGSS